MRRSNLVLFHEDCGFATDGFYVCIGARPNDWNTYLFKTYSVIFDNSVDES